MAVLEKLDKIKFVGGGEGAGKTFLAAFYAIARTTFTLAVLGLEEQLVWICGQDFEDARKELDEVYKLLQVMDAVDYSRTNIPTTKDKRAVVTSTTGVRFETVSVKDETKIGREQPHGVIGAEATRWDSIEKWRRVRGRALRRWDTGVWMYMSGSFEVMKDGWYAEVWATGQGDNIEEITSYELPAWANPVIYPEGESSTAFVIARATEPKDRFEERYAGRPAPPRGTVLPEFKHAIHVSEDARYVAGLPVFLGVDPGGGTSPYAVEAIQMVDDEVHIIDEVYTLGWVHEDIIAECQSRRWWKDVDPGYGTHAMDIAGWQQHGGAVAPVAEWLERTGIQFVGEKYPPRDLVNKLRVLLKINPYTHRPHLLVSPECFGFIVEAGGGKHPEIEDLKRWRMKGREASEDNCHATKGFGYWALREFGTGNVSERDGGVQEQTTYLGGWGYSWRQ